jgi:Flp pilus assembly pilin Flp
VRFFNMMSRQFLAIAARLLAGSRRESGQTFVEYALILAVIAVGTAAALTFLQGQITAMYGQITADVPW